MSSVKQFRVRSRVLIAVLVVALILVGGLALINTLTVRTFSSLVSNISTELQPTMMSLQEPPGAARAASLPQTGGGFDPMLAAQADPQRLIIRNATLSLTVEDVAARVERISTLAAELGGWVVSANSSSGADARVVSANLVVRVPAARLDDALAQIKLDAVRINSEQITGSDVTQEYVDVTSRLDNLEAAERQLQTIMEDADSTEAVLQVFNELTRIRGEIESLRGRMQYLEQASAFSSITIGLTATPVTPPVEVAGWRPLDTARNAAQTLIGVLQGAANLLIFAVVFLLPLLLIAAALVWIGRRLLRRSLAGG